LFLCWALLVPAARTQEAGSSSASQTFPERTPASNRKGKADKNNCKALHGRRIVDPCAPPPKTPLLGRIFLAPFRGIGPKFERGLTYAENHNIARRLQIILSNPYIHPVIGSLGDGSSFGVGVALSTEQAISPNLRIFGSTHATLKKYTDTGAGISFDPTGQALKRFELTLKARHRLRPEEDFWGVGPDPQRTRTTYDMQERSLALEAVLRPARHLRLGAGTEYMSTSIFAGKDGRFPTTQQVFPAVQLPGLALGAALLGTGVFAEFDTRNGSTNPSRAIFLRASAVSNDSVGREAFGFWNYHFDARFYVPLGSVRRVLALRTLLDFNDPKSGGEISFFRLARLGDSRTLRGYDSFRFHARHAAAWNVEYRMDLTGGIGAFAFTDFGQVFNRRSEFNTRNFRVTGGGGLAFKTKKSIFLRAYVGRSGEGNRFFLQFGPTF
jgi:hypothetical protein